MTPVGRTQSFAALAVAGSGWLTASTFLLRMPLLHQWFTRMTAILLLITTVYTAIQVSLVGEVSSIVVVGSLLGGAWAVAVGYVFGWPTIPVWISNLGGGFGVVIGTGYILYRQVESYREAEVETPA